MQIEPYSDTFEQEVIALWERCGLTRSWNDPRKDIARKLQVQRDLFLVGITNGRVVGTVMGGYDGHRGWINYLAIDPACQRKGLGRMLMDEIERRLREIGCVKMNLQIRDDNKDAIAFYERIGFTRDAVISMGKRFQRDG